LRGDCVIRDRQEGGDRLTKSRKSVVIGNGGFYPPLP